ncbi:hypothetical protein HK16_16985 [Acetobacter senegalensis]|uniref:GNAT family acetyltransferase n=5 Tax=Acetobacter TaxID=434 RepID=A0A252EGW6_9PROT|nr:hypothetical protein HC62_14965 [Acetobacter tropicalis]OUL65453.1 hypothetical protein HK16_16985 [Acetobacter senegalensis]GAA09876.1 hypothetical protein ATPR_2880 [Acetobacter tropicalis NBRC 101654]
MILREKGKRPGMHALARITFGAASVLLMVLAVLLVGFGISDLIKQLFSHSWQTAQTAVVHAISYVVIALAVFDVAKYFMEEEVILSRGKHTLAEARVSLTKFITSIIIAVFVEGLVGIFETRGDGPATVIYPASLLIVATLMVFSLGIYLKLSVQAEGEKKKEQLED